MNPAASYFSYLQLYTSHTQTYTRTRYTYNISYRNPIYKSSFA